jgi:hypothetical protein
MDERLKPCAKCGRLPEMWEEAFPHGVCEDCFEADHENAQQSPMSKKPNPVLSDEIPSDTSNRVIDYYRSSLDYLVYFCLIVAAVAFLLRIAGVL